MPVSELSSSKPGQKKPSERFGSKSLWTWGAATLSAFALLFAALQVGVGSSETGTQQLVVHVLATYPHDRGAWTQGLLWHQNKLYESTGMEGQSSLRAVDLQSGEVLNHMALEPSIFAEGLALVGRRLIQLTWKNQKAFVWKLGSFEPLGQFNYYGQGWGLCFDGRSLVMSDGSEMLTFRNPETFDIVSTVRVLDEGRPVRRLNELECVDEFIYANIWTSDTIVRIDSSSGVVNARIDASGLLSPRERSQADVLNGIAYLENRQRFLLTGKYWPKMFEVEFMPRPEPLPATRSDR
ncbi:MAG: glutaminyl-peptide cyclotransferase [Myxococcota bacterium]